MSYKTALKIFEMLTDGQLLELQEVGEFNSCCWSALHEIMEKRGIIEE